jgi:hypothetical protein
MGVVVKPLCFIINVFLNKNYSGLTCTILIQVFIYICCINSHDFTLSLLGQNFTPTIIQKSMNIKKTNLHDFPQLNFTDFIGCKNHDSMSVFFIKHLRKSCKLKQHILFLLKSWWIFVNQWVKMNKTNVYNELYFYTCIKWTIQKCEKNVRKMS